MINFHGTFAKQQPNFDSKWRKLKMKIFLEPASSGGQDIHQNSCNFKYFSAEPCNGYPYPWIFMDISNKLDNGYIHGYPWIFWIKYFEQSFNCKMTAKLTKYSGITLQLINFDCL
jgi:hypothetical protein